MFQKSLKYLTIAIANSLLLLVMLWLCSDKIETLFRPFVFITGLIKIGAAFVLSLLAMLAISMLVAWRGKKRVTSSGRKMSVALMVTISVTAWLYIDLGKELRQHLMEEGNIRRALTPKLKPPAISVPGSEGANLTFAEYLYVAEKNNFPMIPGEATEISYSYQCEYLLPDYELTIHYYVPKQLRVDIFNKRNAQFSSYQSYTITGNRKKVVYTEDMQ